MYAVFDIGPDILRASKALSAEGEGKSGAGAAARNEEHRLLQERLAEAVMRRE